MTSITCSEFFTLSGGCTRGHSLKLNCPDSRVNIRAQFFAIRVIDVMIEQVGSAYCYRLVKCTLFQCQILMMILFVFVVGGYKCLLSLHHGVSVCCKINVCVFCLYTI